eukprot:g52027.t1
MGHWTHVHLPFPLKFQFRTHNLISRLEVCVWEFKIKLAGDICRTRRSPVSLNVVKVVSACCVLQLRAIDA